MGNREDLITGAKQCLLDRGYLRTTARDIAKASGVSLAGIGYHFGSKDALINLALFEAIGDVAGTMAEAVTDAVRAPSGSIERFQAVWDQLTESFATHKNLWLASFEPVAQVGYVPEIQEFLAMAARHSRTGLVALFQGISEDDVDEATASSLGSFYYALMTGLLSQWLINPQDAPRGADFVEAMRRLAPSLWGLPDRPATAPAVDPGQAERVEAAAGGAG